MALRIYGHNTTQARPHVTPESPDTTASRSFGDCPPSSGYYTPRFLLLPMARIFLCLLAAAYCCIALLPPPAQARRHGVHGRAMPPFTRTSFSSLSSLTMFISSCTTYLICLQCNAMRFVSCCCVLVACISF